MTKIKQMAERSKDQWAKANNTEQVKIREILIKEMDKIAKEFGWFSEQTGWVIRADRSEEWNQIFINSKEEEEEA